MIIRLSSEVANILRTELRHIVLQRAIRARGNHYLLTVSTWK